MSTERPSKSPRAIREIISGFNGRQNQSPHEKPPVTNIIRPHLPNGQEVLTKNQTYIDCINLMSERRGQEPVSQSEIANIYSKHNPGKQRNQGRIASTVVDNVNQLIKSKGYKIISVTGGKRWADKETAYDLSEFEPKNPDENGDATEQEDQPRNGRLKFPPPDPESVAVIFAQRKRQKLPPEEQAKEQNKETQRTRAQVEILLTRELVLPSQAEKPGKKIDLLKLIKRVNPSQNVTIEEIIGVTNKDDVEYLLRDAKRFAVAAVHKTIQRWWDIKKIEDLEPVEKKPAEKFLELKTQGLDIQEVLNQIINKL